MFLRFPCLTPMNDHTSGESIGARTRRAAGWQMLTMGTNFGFQMITSVVLANLLMPSDFGIVGMATLVVALAVAFRDLGLGQALIQRDSIGPHHIRAAFWGTILMGASICGALVLIAPWVGVYFREPRMVPVLQLLSLSFVISPFAVVPRALLQRELNFRTPFFAEVPAALTTGVTGIGMALLGYSYWSLVGAQLASSFVRSLSLCILTRYVPPLIPTFRGIGDLYSFGVGATGANLGRYIAVKIDYFVVGRRLDASALGLYTRAYQFVTYPSLITRAIGPIFFPAFSRMQDDPARMRNAYGRVVTLLSLIFFPVLVIAVVTAPELIPTVFGDQWKPSVLPTQILTFVGLCGITATPTGAVVKGVGRVYGEAWRQLLYGVMIGTGAWFCSPYGISAVALAVVGATAIHYTLMAQLVWSAIGFGLTDYLRAYRGPLITSAIAAGVSLLIRMAMLGAGYQPAVVLLATIIPASLVAWLLTVYLPFQEVKEALHEFEALYHRGKSLIGRR